MKKSIKVKKFFIVFISILLSFCAPKKKIEIAPQVVEYQNKEKEADTLFKKGSYTCLKEAFQIYHDLLSEPHSQEQTKEKLIKTGLLLTLREKELGVLKNKYLEQPSDMIKGSPSLSEFLLYLEIISLIPTKTKGATQDEKADISQVFATWDKLKKNVDTWNEHLKEKSETDEFVAYLYISLNRSLPLHIKTKDKPDFFRFLEVFPDSSLIQYILSLYPKENQKSLEELVQKEPRFHEVYYFLGEIALRRQQLITAERNFLKAYEQIPESSSTIISLASIYFGFEELEKSLEFHEEALKMAPAYRTALLGKALCLGYLGKNKEAVEVLNVLIKFGKYLMGDAHYWLAWNHNELENLDEAWENIEKAKDYFVGYSQVLSLAGVIAFNKENLEVAEENLKEALKLDLSNCEASYYLGKAYAVYQDWKESGIYFEKAALCNEGKEKKLEDKIKEIENSDFSEERKERLIKKKRIQLRKTVITKATFFYNAAAGYFNAGMKEQALSLAQKATLHSAFKEKAEELILKIKQLNQDLVSF
jgi:tetratricopeptide (TPR) repeat protein